MTPEEKARQNIDRQLEACGWQVQDYRQMDLSAGLGIAVREFPLTSGEADYLLYADGRAIGVVEAKPEGHTLKGVEPQSDKYVKGLPPGLPNYRLPLPFAYESTGSETQFTSILEPHARSRPVFTFHRPDELIRLVLLDEQTRSLLKAMPPLDEGQHEPRIDRILQALAKCSCCGSAVQFELAAKACRLNWAIESARLVPCDIRSSLSGGQESGQEWDGKLITSCYPWNAKTLVFAGISRGSVSSNQQVAGSNPAGGTDKSPCRNCSCDCGRRNFLITHDLRFASRADRIFYLDRATLLEDGSPEELLVAQGRYAALYRLQAGTRDIQPRHIEADPLTPVDATL